MLSEMTSGDSLLNGIYSINWDEIQRQKEIKAIAAIRAYQDKWQVPRQIVKNGQWVSGCTGERPQGWEQMKVMEVEAC